MNQYRIEYRHNGVASYLELYLFVNPLGQSCYISEKEILKLPHLITSKIDFHILPLLNQNLIQDYMRRHQMDASNLQLRNQVYRAVYQAAIAYKAACIQGKKIGRLFLLRIQELAKSDILTLDEDHFISIAKDLQCDVETFMSDYRSDFVRQLFIKDQRIAQELQVTQSPSLVIFEFNHHEGRVLTNRPITCKQALEEIDSIVKENIIHHQKRQSKRLLKLVKNKPVQK